MNDLPPVIGSVLIRKGKWDRLGGGGGGGGGGGWQTLQVARRKCVVKSRCYFQNQQESTLSRHHLSEMDFANVDAWKL